MAIQATEKIWHNGKLIRWNDAQLHVMSHVINYGSSVFEGIRCYAHADGPAIFRLREDLPDRDRLLHRPAVRGRLRDRRRQRRVALLPAPHRPARLWRSRSQPL